MALVTDGDEAAGLSTGAVHVTLHIWQTRASNCVELLTVLADATGRVQPLDCRAFGELKSRARAGFNHTAMTIGTITMGDNESVNVLVKCRNTILAQNVKRRGRLKSL
jgi:hypothetical protein